MKQSYQRYVNNGVKEMNKDFQANKNAKLKLDELYKIWPLSVDILRNSSND
jgi:hypothetical protein